MKVFITCLILGSLFGIVPPPSAAQQHQSPQYSAPEFETLKNRVSKLEKQLQTVENVEKMELQAQLAEANAKLIGANAKLANVQFDRFKQDLRVDNDDRMRAWSYWFFGILGVVALISGAAVWFSLKTLIENNVEKRLNGFKDGLRNLDIQTNQFRESEKENAAYRLEEIHYDLNEDTRYPREIRVLREEALLDVFNDEKYNPELRYKAAEVLASRASPQLISPILELLNLAVDSDADTGFSVNRLCGFVSLLGHLHTQASYQGLRGFLNCLITEKPKHKDLLLAETVCSFARVSASLGMKNSVSILRRAIPHFENANHTALVELAEHFDIFNKPVGIKDILMHQSNEIHSGVKDEYLELLEKHDPEFVEKWRAEHTTDNAES